MINTILACTIVACDDRQVGDAASSLEQAALTSAPSVTPSVDHQHMRLVDRVTLEDTKEHRRHFVRSGRGWKAEDTDACATPDARLRALLHTIAPTQTTTTLADGRAPGKQPAVAEETITVRGSTGGKALFSRVVAASEVRQVGLAVTGPCSAPTNASSSRRGAPEKSSDVLSEQPSLLLRRSATSWIERVAAATWGPTTPAACPALSNLQPGTRTLEQKAICARENRDAKRVLSQCPASFALRGRIDARRQSVLLDAADAALIDDGRVVLGPVVSSWAGALGAAPNPNLEREVCSQPAHSPFQTVSLPFPGDYQPDVAAGEDVSVELALVFTGATSSPCGQGASRARAVMRVLAWRLATGPQSEWINAAPWQGPKDCMAHFQQLDKPTSKRIESDKPRPDKTN